MIVCDVGSVHSQLSWSVVVPGKKTGDSYTTCILEIVVGRLSNYVVPRIDIQKQG